MPGQRPGLRSEPFKFDFSNSYSSWGGRANNGSENTICCFNDDFNWVRGKHTIKIGGMFQLFHYNGYGRQCTGGCGTFSALNTGRPADTNFTTGGGNPIASMLLGYANGGSIAVLCGLYSGRFPGYEQVNDQLRPALGNAIAADWPRRPLERFFADHA